jgi:hypothetical protein
VNIQRDSYASYIGHYPMLAYFAIAENESIGRERYNFMQVTRQLAFTYTNLYLQKSHIRGTSAFIVLPLQVLNATSSMLSTIPI